MYFRISSKSVAISAFLLALPVAFAQQTSVFIRSGQLEDTADLFINPNGELSYVTLPDIDIDSAQVVDNTDASCFFWRYSDTVNQPEDTAPFISQPVTTQRMLNGKFSKAERLYCYNSAADRSSNNVFTVAIANDRETVGLARLQLNAPRETIVEKDMIDNYHSLTWNVIGAGLVGWPADMDFYRSTDELPACVILNSNLDFSPTISLGKTTRFPRHTYLHKIGCFHNGVQPEKVALWQRDGYSGFEANRVSFGN